MNYVGNNTYRDNVIHHVSDVLQYSNAFNEKSAIRKDKCRYVTLWIDSIEINTRHSVMGMKCNLFNIKVYPCGESKRRMIE